MLIRELFLNEKEDYNRRVHNIVQSWEWGDAKEATGKKVFRYGFFEGQQIHGGFQLSLHSLPGPLYKWNIGYLPRSVVPDKDMLNSLAVFGHQNSCVFIKLEPDVFAPTAASETQPALDELKKQLLATEGVDLRIGKEFFPPHNFLLDISRGDEELFAQMHAKTRYNIGLAQRKGVKIEIRTDDDAFKIFLKLHMETARRNKFYSHDAHYHYSVWQSMRKSDMARIIIASVNDTPTCAWMMWNFQDTLYYPYGGTSVQFRNAMSSNLVAWEAIQLGKRMGLKTFNMWGAMGLPADTEDPWYGFHRFKEGYAPVHVTYLGTYDLVINPQMYSLYLFLEKWRWRYLTFRARFR